MKIFPDVYLVLPPHPAIGHLPVTLLKTQYFTALLKVIEDEDFLQESVPYPAANLQHHALGRAAGTHRKQSGAVSGGLHRLKITALPLKRLLERIGDYQQERQLTRLAVMLTLHLFIRSRELRFARWSKIDFRHKIWTIAATRETIEKVRFSGRAQKCVLHISYRFPDRPLPF